MRAIQGWRALAACALVQEGGTFTVAICALDQSRKLTIASENTPNGHLFTNQSFLAVELLKSTKIEFGSPMGRCFPE